MNLDSHFTSIYNTKETTAYKQYASCYFIRLAKIKKPLATQAHSKWPQVKVLNNIVEVRPGEKVVIIGTLYKEMSLKPSVMTETSLTGVGILKRMQDKIFSDGDTIIIEDDTV